jgi:hypothetical protein
MSSQDAQGQAEARPDGLPGTSPTLDEARIVSDNWARYEYGRARGHKEYCQKARRLEDYYLGGGLQWEPEDRRIVEEEQGRMALEFNEIMPAINAAVGYQIANRADISFQPRGGMATQEIANVLSKLVMQIADQERLHWKETEVYCDGMIQQRGYFDLRIRFTDTMRGEIEIDTLDPMDVIPDPNAKTYDPDEGWGDVIVTRWMTLDEIEDRYGTQARVRAESSISGSAPIADVDWGDFDESAGRNKFGMLNLPTTYDAIQRDGDMIRVRVVDRQKVVWRVSEVLVSPDTGDVRLAEDLTPEKLAIELSRGWILTKKLWKRIRWTVTTYTALLHDDWSPYPWITVVPYFPYFRRGRTRGMVDNAVGPQNALNKSVSQYIHIINTAANSGWFVEENSLTNMTTSDLEEEGGKSGLVIEHKQGKRPEKIQPNQIPTGVDRMIDRLMVTLKENTVPDAARGLEGQEKSGLAIQSRQHAAQQQLAIPLDNLARTRHILAERMLWMIQHYYDEPRVFQIIKRDPATGERQIETLKVNQIDEATGEVLNDLTLGEYSVVITEVPMQVTFENGQFEQLLKMRQLGVRVPDFALVRASSVPDKTELLEAMEAQQPQPDPLTSAKVELTKAQTEKVKADAVQSRVQSEFASIQTAQTIARIPQTAPTADAILKSAGFEDQDQPPIIPEPAPGTPPPPPPPANTDPLTPAHAAVGAEAGVKGGARAPVPINTGDNREQQKAQ